jgi:hypothetical protein
LNTEIPLVWSWETARPAQQNAATARHYYYLNSYMVRHSLHKRHYLRLKKRLATIKLTPTKTTTVPSPRNAAFT